MDKIAVLIPCYNEGLTIAKVVSDFFRVLPGAVIYVYDNNSTDDTVLRAKEAGAVVRHEKKQGKGTVIRRMFREVEAECYVLADGDNACPAEVTREMSELILNKSADMVIADRLSGNYFQVNTRPMHNFGNRLICFLTNFLFQSNIGDVMSGYRTFNRRFVKSFPAESDGFEIDTEMSIFGIVHSMRIREVQISYCERNNGSQSKVRTYSDGWKIIKKIIKLFFQYRIKEKGRLKRSGQRMRREEERKCGKKS